MKKNQKNLALLLWIVFAGIVFQMAFGHGLGFETLPPQMLGDRKVAMEVNSTIDNATHRKQIVFSMFDTSTGLTVRDVTYHIKVIKHDGVLFEGNYQTKNGVLTLDLIPDENAQILIQEKTNVDVFNFLVGGAKNTVEAKGKVFKEGGLYKFSIGIVSAENYSDKTHKPVVFESGLSFAETIIHKVNDAQYGTQKLRVVSYYDVLDEVGYGPKTKSVFFSMPFEWTENNINQTSVVHQEVFIPKTFGALQVSEYDVSANGFTLPKDAITIDDFVDEYRVIHILLYQTQLEDINDKQDGTQNKLNFLVMPKSNDLLLADVTTNVQYKIAMTIIPNQLVPGQEATLLFKIYDVFLQGKAVSVNYDLSVRSDKGDIYKTSGTSSDSKDEWNQVKLHLPADVSGKITVTFENLGGNKLANADLPLIVSSGITETNIPSWIKNNADWWCKKLISDDEFLRAIEYLINKNIIDVGVKSQNTEQKGIPEWVRNNSCWWADGSISNNEFASGIAYLVKNGIIRA
jgi:hypothetical protein